MGWLWRVYVFGGGVVSKWQNGNDPDAYVQHLKETNMTDDKADGFFASGRVIWQRANGELLRMGSMHDHVIAQTFAKAMNTRATDTQVSKHSERAKLNEYHPAAIEVGQIYFDHHSETNGTFECGARLVQAADRAIRAALDGMGSKSDA